MNMTGDAGSEAIAPAPWAAFHVTAYLVRTTTITLTWLQGDPDPSHPEDGPTQASLCTMTLTHSIPTKPHNVAGWTNDGPCRVPAASQKSVPNVGPHNKLVAHGIPCDRAATSVQMMMNKNVQFTRTTHFKFRSDGWIISDAPLVPGDDLTRADWHYRWTCVRRSTYVKGGGPEYPTTCTTGTRRITFILEP